MSVPAQFFFDFAKLADGDIELVTVITNAACIRYQLLGEALTLGVYSSAAASLPGGPGRGISASLECNACPSSPPSHHMPPESLDLVILLTS